MERSSKSPSSNSQTKLNVSEQVQPSFSTKRDEKFSSILLGSFHDQCPRRSIRNIIESPKSHPLSRHSSSSSSSNKSLSRSSSVGSTLDSPCFIPKDSISLIDIPAPAFNLIMDDLPLKDQIKIVYLSKTLLTALESKHKSIKNDPSIYIPMLIEQIESLITKNYEFEVKFIPTKKQTNFQKFISMTLTEKELKLVFHEESYIPTITKYFPKKVIKKEAFGSFSKSNSDSDSNSQSFISPIGSSSQLKSQSSYKNDEDYPMFKNVTDWEWFYDPKYTYTIRFNHVNNIFITKDENKEVLHSSTLSKVLEMLFDLLQTHRLKLIHQEESRWLTYILRNSNKEKYFYFTNEKEFPTSQTNTFDKMNDKFKKVCKYFDVFQRVVNRKHSQASVKKNTINSQRFQ